MQNGKSPGKDGLTKQIYKNFWDELKEIFVDSLKEAKEIGHPNTPQRKAIIKLIEKKNKKKIER